MRLSIAQPLIFRSFCLNGSFSPAATRIICSTRSSPVIISDHRVLDLEARVHFEEVEALVRAAMATNSTVPRAVVVHRPRQGATACSPIAMRVFSSSSGDGASSMTF